MYSNKEVFEGEFSNGKRQGQGVHTYTRGKQIRGVLAERYAGGRLDRCRSKIECGTMWRVEGR